jgi:hypothetical protein
VGRGQSAPTIRPARARRDVAVAGKGPQPRGANGRGRSAQEEPGVVGVLTHGTDRWCKAAGSGTAKRGGGIRGRASGSCCEGGGRRLRAGVERGGAGVLRVHGIGRRLTDVDESWWPVGGGGSGGRVRVALGFLEGKVMRPRERERERERGGGGGEEGRAAGVASPRGHAGPASGRWHGDAVMAGQRATPGRVDGEE